MNRGKATDSSGNDGNALLHNMTASLSWIAGILSIVSACSVSCHNTRVMTQSMTFQALVGPGLVLCGLLLVESDVELAAGTVQDNLL